MNKQLYFAVLICVGLGLFYFVTQKDKVKVGIRELVLPNFKQQEIDKIEINGLGKIELFKADDRWQLVDNSKSETNYFANADYVSDLLNAAENLNSYYFATEIKEKSEEFAVSNDKAVKVRLYSGSKVVWELLIGKEIDDEQRYVRAPYNPSIFVAKGRFWDLTRQSVSEWRDRQIIPLRPDEISKFTFAKQNKVFTVSWKNERWTLSDDSGKLFASDKLNNERIAELVEALANVRVLDFITDNERISAAKSALLKPSFIYTIYDSKGTFYVLDVAFNLLEQKVLAQLQGGHEVYEISNYAFTKLNISLDELLLNQKAQTKN
ncbi:MAG: DUF4340 domain-containing protein [bacterium]|nr:DUF4340 domain-containing protein [bacterium]